MTGLACVNRPPLHAVRLRLGVVEQVAELIGRDIGQLEAAGVELFVDLDDRVAHQAVSLFRAAGEQEIVAASDAFVAVVGVEGQAQQAGDAAFGDSIVAHSCRCDGMRPDVRISLLHESTDGAVG